MLDIKDSYVAYCLDESTMIFGSWIESELDSVQGKTAKQTAAKREQKLDSLLDTKGKAKRFADPAFKFKKPQGGES